jgi:predicted MFS family arabinose efflux permease
VSTGRPEESGEPGMGAQESGAEAAARQRQLDRFVRYRALSRAYFHLPVLFVYLYAGGLPVAVVEVLLAVYGLLIVLGAPASGRLLQRMSLRAVVCLGEALKVAGVALLAAGPRVPTALAGQAVGALGYSLAAGTDSALLSGLAGGDRELYRRYEARSAAAIFLAALVGGVVGAVLFVRERALPFWASVACSLAALATAARIRPAAEPPAPPRGEAAPVLPAAERFWLRYYAITRAFVLAPYVGLLPFLLYVTLKVPVALFGVVLGVYGLTSVAVARSSGRLARTLGPRRLGWASMALCAAALAVLGLAGSVWVALLGVLALGLGGGVVRPVAMSNLDAAMVGWSGAQRSALLSTQERLYGAWNTAILLAGGLALQATGIRAVLVGLAVVYALTLTVLAALPR